jgi:hypothetical protein
MSSEKGAISGLPLIPKGSRKIQNVIFMKEFFLLLDTKETKKSSLKSKA